MATTQAQKGDTPDKSAKDTANARTPHACACLTGTGKTCPDTTSKAFHQGHDARMASRLAQDVADGKMTVEAADKLIREAGGSDLLAGKMRHSAKLRQDKAAAKAAGPQAEPKAPKGLKATKEQAANVAKAPSLVGSKVKAAHGQRQLDAVIVRNASNDLVARHRLNGKDCDHAVAVDGDRIKVESA